MTEDADWRSVLARSERFAAMSAVEELDQPLHPQLLAVGPDGQMIDEGGIWRRTDRRGS